MLQPRYSSTPIFSDWATPGSREKGSVANATRFDAKFISSFLPNYELRWSSPRISTYIFYAFERRSDADLRRHDETKPGTKLGRDQHPGGQSPRKRKPQETCVAGHTCRGAGRRMRR